MKVAARLPLTEDCHHYHHIGEVPWDIQKYWQQRYSIFSWYDSNIRLTDDAWFGVTPEPIANKIAEHATSPRYSSKSILIDIFAGAGGNTIAFALSGRWDYVIAVEKDAATLACAQHNASVYGVEDAITWVHGDCFDLLYALQSGPQGKAWKELPEELRVDVADVLVFASPPWGGVSYRDHEVFDLETMEPYNLSALHEACSVMDHLLYLPRTSDLQQIAELAPRGEKIGVVQYCMKGASKAMVAYIPGHQ